MANRDTADTTHEAKLEARVSARSAPRHRCAGAGLRPLLTRRPVRTAGPAVNGGLRPAWRSTVRGRTSARQSRLVTRRCTGRGKAPLATNL